ncbi:putative N-acetyltransferase ESCO, zinc-finger, N-acetyltransferase ESCO, acetyl-transferase [Medicago truncatula]|uniref:N-acetyltransferase ESCO2-like protein n=1 Tax=Medicago truncatula TaxID=3880 RepID=G7IMD6_MEDTR|nr:protein CHROMOSOME TRANSMISSION FIDELITY 7 [Medicago truncatula]AES68051.1 N-acetyltransferase ESCO2-like protein [Medicago truncatula]RHN76439.1 putative N-acetyltransferase ESCO, zinc-finger, N-acetyltransferase ESCO, acetyl-transferase [Medicago truncatula]
MQSKINRFFKSPAIVADNNVGNDDLSNWDWENKKQHSIFNTYARTGRNLHSIASPSTVIQKPIIEKNKKISYDQLHLDFVQSDFLLRPCSICGVRFTPGNVEDEKLHAQFHKRFTQGIQFRCWNNERVISSNKSGRIVLILDTDPSSHRNKVEEVVKMMEIELGSGWIAHQDCKVYLFVSLQRIVGCVVAEPIKEAFRVVSCSDTGHYDNARKKERKVCPTTLQFGNIVFQREVEKRSVNASDSEVSVGRAIFCESKPVAAVCGIRAIWVTASNRRKHFASQLLDAVRKSFCTGLELERTQLAFSLPTSAGKALACSYVDTGSFLVYKLV